ncbi:lytic murein transglycosylase [Aureimonas sp. OT7]|uniref:Membrane protein n=1 Tax=Aureimonas altamirensis TaxID=370622 RepID=A0A0B1Q4X0_9HYPH|nr:MULTISPECIES: lytic murein transglycosylase [Aureimonas]KHJ55903.1 membrane protein [Aureimonas altamirensis]QOG08074.1 lytic murein transglycosylase [Aureimonas sp. OT7]
MIQRIAILLVTLFAILASPAAAQTTEAGFRTFLEQQIWPQARAKGVSRGTFDAALGGVKPNLKLPDLVLPGQSAEIAEKQHQAEFQSPAAYFKESNVASVAARGRSLLQQHAATLKRIEQRYGVPGPIVVAVWGRESGFGSASIPHDAFEVLATKAYLARRKDMFRAELIAALQIVQDGDLSVRDMKSSWAGALGQPQFMPTKFRELAVDFDGDGRRDIWNSVPDTLASIAHYLQQSGWVAGRDWGFEANVPDAVSCTLEGPDQGRPIRDFISAGVTRVSGRPFPPHEASATGYLMMPAGRMGPAFIATPNFYVIKQYNNSDLYALFIGHVADRMQGGSAFRGDWVKVEGVSRGDVARMQQRLEAMGRDVGGADGLPGFKTRRSIGAFEAENGLRVDCWPTAELKKRLN